MKPRETFKERKISGAQWFWFLALMGLLTRLPLLRLNAAETTDGVWCLSYFSPSFLPNDRFVIFPGYPFLVHLGQLLGTEGTLWGRGLSSLAGLLFLIPLWRFCRRWMSRDVSGMVCAMALFSPLLWQWSLKVMPDVFFLLAFWLCLERLVAASVEKKPSAWLLGCISAAAAACIRPEGYLLFPWVLYLSEKLEGGSKWGRRLQMVAFWTIPALLLKPKVLTILDAYGEGMGLNPGLDPRSMPFLNFVEHLYAYLSQPIYVFTPLVYWFAILGLGKMVRRRDEEGTAFRRIMLQVYIVLFLSRLFPMAYQDRYLLPYLPLLMAAAGYHLETFIEHWKEKGKPIKAIFWKNGLLALCLGWLSLYSIAALICQYDSFGDIKRSAEYLKNLPSDAVIYTDEIQKTQYWSGRKVLLMPHLYENTVFQPQKGDYVILHSFYTPRIAMFDRHLEEVNGARLLYENPSVVVPLLTDTMEDPKLQNRISATAFRFQPQFFRSQVYVIQK